MPTLINTKIGGYYFTQLNDNELEIKQSMKHKENNNIPVAFGLIILLLIMVKVATSFNISKFTDLYIYVPVIGMSYFLLTYPIQKIIFINRQTKTFTALTFNFISKLTMGKFLVGKKEYHFSSFKACIVRADDNIICFMVDNELIGFTGTIKKSEEREKVCDIVNEFVR